MAASPLTNGQKYDLITSNLQEVMGGDIIREVLVTRPLKIYWGTATTGRPHAAYFVPAIKIAQFLLAGCRVKVLLADIHGFLDADKAPEGVLERRARYYERVIRSLLKAVGVDSSSVEFVRGGSYQLTPRFSRDLLRLSKCLSVHDALKASSEVVKNMGQPSMMQLLDEEYLDVDAEFGGVDQRKTFALANDTMANMGFKVRAHLMNPMVPGLTGGKMSSSDVGSKIGLLDSPEEIHRKITKAYCAPRETRNNGILAFIQHVLLPYSQLQSQDGTAAISMTPNDQIQPMEFTSFDAVKSAYESGILTPQMIKKVVEDGLVKLIDSIRLDFAYDEEWQALSADAYPDPSTTRPRDQLQKKATKVVMPFNGDRAKRICSMQDLFFTLESVIGTQCRYTCSDSLADVSAYDIR